MIITITFQILGGVIKIKRFWFGRDDPTQCKPFDVKSCTNNTMHIKQNENGKRWCDNDRDCKFTACKSFETFSRNNKPQTCAFIKKESQAQVFSVNFAKFLRTPFFTEHLQWLLLFSGTRITHTHTPTHTYF